MATLRAVAAQFRAMADGGVTQITRAELATSARPLAPYVRAAILNTPARGPKHTGLRLRIARCVQTWATIDGPVVSVGVEVNSARMPDGEKSLPLMLNGTKVWRHPLFGRMETWVTQPSWPYFYEAVAWYGPASRLAMSRAERQIADRLSG
jgi:hypothetical protein